MNNGPADPVEIAASLIRCDSVTPRDGGALPALARFLDGRGFHTEIVRFSEPGVISASFLPSRPRASVIMPGCT